MFSSASIVIGGTKKITNWRMSLDDAAVELHINTTYYAQRPELNKISLWKKPTSNWW